MPDVVEKDFEERGRFLLELYRKALLLSGNELYEYFLDHAVNVTKSTIGFFHFVSPDQSSIILTAWNTEALKNCTANYATHYPIEQAGNWADCIRLKRAVIYNDFAQSPNQKGLPQGHVSIKRILSAPIMEDGKPLAIFGVGNKIAPYNQGDVVQLNLVANELSKIIKQQRAENELRESNENYRSLFSNMLDGFAYCKMIFDEKGKPKDFIYLEVNDAFERLTGLKKEAVVGKRVTEAIPAIREANPEVFDIYGRVAITGKEEKFELFFKPLSIWLDISVYSPRKGYFAAVFENITERKKTMEQLEASRQVLRRESGLLQSVMNGAKNVHLVYLDKDFNFVRVNEAYAETCGYKPEQMIGKNHFALYPNEENEAIFAGVRDTGIPASYHDKPFFFPDQPDRGVTYWDWTLMPIKDSLGRVDGLVFSLVETTDRKKLENEIKETRNYLENLLNYANAPIIVWDPQFKITLFNRAFEHMTGLRANEVLGKRLDLLFPENEKENAMVHIRRALEGEFWESVEIPILNVDRTVKTVLWNSANVYDSTGQRIVATIAQGNDITQRKKAEDALVSSEKRYRRLFETSQDGIMARDLCGRMIDCNQAYATMVGYSKRELKSLPVEVLLPEKWREQRERIFQDILEHGGSVVFEREYLRKDGSVFPASVRSWRLTDEKEETIGVWSIVRDITKQKELQVKLQHYATNLELLVEERTRQLKDAEQLATIGATAGMVGHDIRNPLQAIVNDIYLLKSYLESMPEGQKKFGIQESLDGIDQNVSYINKIIQDLQDFARPINPVTEEIDIEGLCKDTLRNNNVPENIKVSCRVRKEVKKLVTDPNLLKRILSNLVSNAVQAMPGGGKLDLYAYQAANDTVIVVQDTGAGIPEAMKPKLFTPLFTTKSRGQGFGLAVVKRMTEALGGTINFESEVGRGTKFILCLPP
jgi:PAS domain S-box-containing protein